jgi:hypothetical protein
MEICIRLGLDEVVVPARRSASETHALCPVKSADALPGVQAVAASSRNSSGFRSLAERGGFEPPVQVNPAQQVSKAKREESDDTSLDLNPS